MPTSSHTCKEYFSLPLLYLWIYMKNGDISSSLGISSLRNLYNLDHFPKPHFYRCDFTYIRLSQRPWICITLRGTYCHNLKKFNFGFWSKLMFNFLKRSTNGLIVFYNSLIFLHTLVLNETIHPKPCKSRTCSRQWLLPQLLAFWNNVTVIIFVHITIYLCFKY